MASSKRRADEEIRFTAALHHSQPALSVYADGDAKLTLSVDASQLPQVAKTLLLLRGARFDVVIPHDSIQSGQRGSIRKTYR